MLAERRHVARRWLAIVIVASTVMATASAAAAAPEGPDQEERPDRDDALADRALVALDADGYTTDSADQLSSEIDALNARVDEQLERLGEAEDAVTKAISSLADADAALDETHRLIEDLTRRSDDVVISAFVNPPTHDALDVLGAATLEDATIKNALLGMQANDSADVLSELETTRGDLDDRVAKQQKALADAENARAEAEAALADLQAGVGRHAEFIMQVESRLDASEAELAELEKTDPELAAKIRERQSEIASTLRNQAEAREMAEALAKLAEAEKRAEEKAKAEAEAKAKAEAAGQGGGSAPSGGGTSSGWVCPVRGSVSFTDSWGAARSGGRTHKGTDMMASTGTPTVAPVSGRVEHRGTSLGGLSWYLYGDDGNTYYGTHLSGYANQGAGWVAQGTLIGYVGDTGNAAGIPHLHFEYMPGGGASVNPYSRLIAVC